MRKRVHKQRIRRPVNKRRIAVSVRKRFIGKVKGQMISVAYMAGPRKVDAHVFGPLAVHREAELDWRPELFHPGRSSKKGWIVTHIRTGMSIIGRTAGATFQQAMQIARELCDEDWSFGEFGAVGISKARTERLRRVFLEAGIRAGLKVRY